MSASLYEILAHHLNLIQLYIQGKAYLIENTGFNITSLLRTICGTVNRTEIVNEHTKKTLGNLYCTALQYVDTPRDRQLLRGVISHLTSISFASQLEGHVSKCAVRTAYYSFHSNLQRYEHIKTTSQIVRNDMTCEQQHRLTRRIISTRKIKEIKIIAEG